MPWSFLLPAAAGALAGAGAIFLALSGRKKSDGNDGDFIVETDTPNPKWKPGDLQPHPYLDLDFDYLSFLKEGKAADDGRTETGETEETGSKNARIRAALLAAPRHYLDPAETTESALYNFTMSAVVPRPIALISSQSPTPQTGEKKSNGAGRGDPPPLVNLAPYSYCGLSSHSPPHLTIGACHTSGKPDRMKDTLYNILETREFVVNVMSSWYSESANFSCGFFDRGVDEMQLAGLTPQKSVKVAPPRVAEAAVQLECRLVATYPVFSRSSSSVAGGGAAGGGTAGAGEGAGAEEGAGAAAGGGGGGGGEKPPPLQTTTVLIAEVVAIHVLEAVSSPGPRGESIVVDIRKLRPVCRLGMDTYGTLGRVFDLPRPPKEWQDKRS